MRTKATLFLLVLVLALGAVAYYFNRQWDAQRTAVAYRSHVLGPDAVDFDYLRIEFPESPPTIELEKKASGWELLQPVQWPANFFAVNRLVSDLQTLERQSSFAVEGTNLTDYGLAEPQGVLTFGNRGEQGTLRIGKQTDVGGRLYVLPDNNDRVFVVDDTLLRSLQQSVEDFRSDAVFTLAPTEVRSWHIQIAESGNLRIWLSRDGDKWKLETPVQARADKAAVEVLLNRLLSNLEVERFETGLTDLNLIRLATPDFIVAFEGASRREALHIGGRVPGQPADRQLHFAKLENNPTIIVIEAGFLDDLRTAQLRLRERDLLEFEPARIQSITIEPGGPSSPIELQRLEDGRWQVVSRNQDGGFISLPADAERIQNLVEHLENVRAQPPPGGFVSDAPSADDLANTYFLTNPSWTITIVERPEQAGGSPVHHTLLLGGIESEHVFAQAGTNTGAARTVYRIDRGLADDLRSEPRHYRDRQLQSLTQGARITALSIRRLIDDTPKVAAELTSLEQTWSTALASHPADEREQLLALISELRNLRAREIVATEFSTSVPNEPGERPWTWLLEASINLVGGPGQTRTFRLYLDDYHGGQNLLAASPDLNLVFSATQPFIDAFGPLVFQREDPGPPPAGADKPPGATEPESSPPAESPSPPTGAAEEPTGA